MCINVELYESFDNAENINVYNNGEMNVYGAGTEEFDNVLTGWKIMTDGARDMPAFGVSLNSETLKVLKSGIWVEFYFGKVYESNGMPYEKLLINVQKSSYGFNLIRYNSQGGYYGRCFYYDLAGNTMDDFYDILQNL